MTTSSIDLPPLPFFDPYSDPSSTGPRWTLWKRRFERYIAALGISDPTRKRALLLYQSGPATQDIFDTLPDTGDTANYTLAMQELDAYFTPLKNVDFEIFTFRKESQRSDETLDQYVTRLRKLASTCDFADVDKEIKSILIQNCSSKRLRRYAFVEADVTLSQLLQKPVHLSQAKFTLLVWRPPYKLRQYPTTKHKPFHPNIALRLTTNHSHSHARLQHAHLKIVVVFAVDPGLIVRVPAPQKVKVLTHTARLIILPWYVVVANALSLTPHDKPSSKYLQMQRLPLMYVTLLVRKRNIFLRFK